MASFFGSNYPWYSGAVYEGAEVHNLPQVFAGQIQKQGGQRSFPPSVTAPGTLASATAVVNNTGYDCLVYAAATTGIGGIKVVTYNGATSSTVSPVGTVSSAATATVLVPGPGAIIPTYTGTLTWTWQPL